MLLLTRRHAPPPSWWATRNPPEGRAPRLEADAVSAIDPLVVSGKVYQLQERSSLGVGGWSNVPGGGITAIGGPLTMTDPGGRLQAQRFYRVLITP